MSFESQTFPPEKAIEGQQFVQCTEPVIAQLEKRATCVPQYSAVKHTPFTLAPMK